MAITTRHKKAIKNLRKYTTRKEAMIQARYSPSYADSGQVNKTKGWQELMEKNLPDKDLLKTHKEGLVATKMQGVGGMVINTESGKFGHSDIEIPDFPTRHKYLETAYKIKGKYPQQGVGVAVQLNIGKDREEYA